MRQRFGPYAVDLENLDKVLYPGDGITKGDIIDYYRGVSKVMLPWLQDRVLTMQRFPDGIENTGFFQKSLPDYFPDWFARQRVDTSNGRQTVPLCNNLASLAYVAGQASLTQHTWLSRVDRIHFPDQMIFDLDPPDEEFEPVRRAARDCLALLDELSLVAGLKTTGSRGLHVVVPLRRQDDFDTVREFARDCGRVLVNRYPGRYTLAQRIEKRAGKLYLDVQRNAYGQTAVAPLSLRALPGAPVAMPIPPDALDDRKLDARRYTLLNASRYLESSGNPWKDLRRRARSLNRARKDLDDMMAGKGG